ncbi:MAG: NAD(P)/FAD-dependent oxidoreductase [Prevotella sp.]|nr:NAD(P)/FAD-dependent oxidoreductase [Prevotella sp.]
MNKLIIIGAGPGGYETALYAAGRGMQVTLIEESHVGGTCLNVGCIPTKTYVHAASFEEAVERRPQVIEQLRSGVEQLLTHPNITLIRSHAEFTDAHSLSLSDGSSLDINCPVIIATGSETKFLPLPDIDDPRLVDSTGMLSLTTLPKKLCIIGAGVIGMEFASIFNRFGSEVTVIEYLKECLPVLDSDIAKRLRKSLEKRGVTFKMKTTVQSLSDIDADVILMATGRKPRTEGYGLEKTGVEYSAKGIVVDDNMQTNVKGIYAIGDVNARQMLAHAATYQGRRAVNSILGIKDAIRLDIMPSAVFTIPEAASIGLSEDKCKEQAIPFEVHKSFYRANGKALAMDATEGMLKLMVEPDTGLILGCHVYGAHAADLVQEVSVLMCRDTTLAELRDMVHIHPTLSEVLSNCL